jgi:EAL domain-containing protein (putative c-di-GMP-specific phosphodiesterase class I)
MALFLQPIVAAESLEVVKFEALIRWRHPDRGLLAPDSFIPIAEQELAVIDRLTRWVFETALDAHLGLLQHDVESSIAVNLSARNLCALDLPDRLETLLRRKGTDPRVLQLEVTESAVVSNSAVTIDILSRCRQTGMALALDDCGTGFAALDVLKRLPFCEIKIDKVFVANMLVDPDAHETVRSAIGMARRLSLRTVAEGVETAQTAAELRTLGVDNLQGHYISRPQPVENIPATVAALQRGREAMEQETRRGSCRPFP